MGNISPLPRWGPVSNNIAVILVAGTDSIFFTVIDNYSNNSNAKFWGIILIFSIYYEFLKMENVEVF